MLGFDRRTRALEAQRAQLRTIMLYASNSRITNRNTQRKKKKKKSNIPSSKYIQKKKIPSACGYPLHLKLKVYQFCRTFAALAGIFNPSFNDLFSHPRRRFQRIQPITGRSCPLPPPCRPLRGLWATCARLASRYVSRLCLFNCHQLLTFPAQDYFRQMLVRLWTF